jgi:hypothetical protein
MARSQTWARNISRKKARADAPTQPARGIVDGGGLDKLKRRAEDLGLILHAGKAGKPAPGGHKKGGGKKDGGK